MLRQDAYERERLENVRPRDGAIRSRAIATTWSSSAPVRQDWSRRARAASLGAKVALVERALLGGDCLNVGCVPSKTIIRTSRLYAEMRNAEHYGAQFPATSASIFPP